MKLNVKSIVVLALASLVSAANNSKAAEFRVTFDPKIASSFTGRVYVMTSKRTPRIETPSEPNWFSPAPFFAVDVKDVKPGEPIAIGADSLGFPAPLQKLEPGQYLVQAVMDFNLGERSFASAAGNGYSRWKSATLGPNAAATELVVDQTVAPRTFQESPRLRLVDIKSQLLSKYRGREVRMQAAVALPESYSKDTDKRYPVIYEIPGFGGTHHTRDFYTMNTVKDGEEFLAVLLNPECPLGHHVFADSANNGPCGQALIEELIPHIEKIYRAVGKAESRFVTGHSSGGWSSLWLQVEYPDDFGGVWSTAPDPVDFRDFQLIDLYSQNANMFTDERGNPRPIARRGETPMLFYKAFSDMEVVFGRGGQLGSFEAVFSPRMPDGTPRKLWDRKTGTVDPETAETWKKYDIRLKLEREWPTLSKKLNGKLHVYMGATDTFYLEGATKLLKLSLQRLGSDAKVEIFPGKDHGSLMDSAMRGRIAREMANAHRRATGRPLKEAAN
jgi:enterochelin esterase-like enzyme